MKQLMAVFLVLLLLSGCGVLGTCLRQYPDDWAWTEDRLCALLGDYGSWLSA